MAMRRGRCLHFGNCPQADRKVLLEVPDGQQFVCPDCGHTLQPILSEGLKFPRWLPIAAVGVLLLGVSYWAYQRFSSRAGRPGDGTETSLPNPKGGREGEIRVRLNIWVGCVGGLAANGGLDTQPGSIFDQKGLKVSFKIIDDWTEGATALATNNVDMMLTTTDVWAKDYVKFKENGFSARAFFMVDWSHGADGVIGRDGIRRIEDLADKSIAYAPYTPSHFLIWNGLKNSGLSRPQRDAIMVKAIHTKDGIEPATLFAQGKVDAAVAWDPDMSDAVSRRAGATKIYDTTIASKLIADVLVVSDAFLRDHPETVTKFAEGWLMGVEYIKSDPSRAYNLIGAIKDFNIPSDLAKTMLQGVTLSNYSENDAFFGTAGALSDYSNIFGMAQDMYRELLQIKQRTQDIEETMTRQVILALKNRFPTQPLPGPTYGGIERTAIPISTQFATINFDPDSAQISMDSKAVVDEIGKFMKAYENTVVEIVGNTDSTGNRSHNIALSEERAVAVRKYLIETFAFPASRIRTDGKGPDNPVADNATSEGRQKNRRSDIKAFANTGK